MPYANRADHNAQTLRYYHAHKEQRRKWYIANRETILEKMRQRHVESPPNPERVQAASRRYFERRLTEPDLRQKMRARYAVKNELKRGRMVRLPCEICGEPKVQAHHPWGYSEEMKLAVWWLCSPHHGLLHRQGEAAA